MRTLVVVVQAATFVALTPMMVAEGQWRLGAAQLCLAVVTGLVYL